MSQSAIAVRGLGKMYQLGIGASHDALRDRLAEGVKSIFSKRGRQNLEKEAREFWALRDIAFDVEPGQVVGVIGRNGAGKSTLLKLLSQITEPTTGEIRIRGRIASLLEVGTGFHPELSGAENVYLNGAILGISRAEIKRRFDEIVSFAEVEKFINTPVKRYSSGMYMRLAFSVAAHLDAEILVVDEVLAVGDAEFREKCMGKMEGVANTGRTVLFVSHNIAAIRRLCNYGIYLRKGQLEFHGPIVETSERYLADTRGLAQQTSLSDRTDRKGSGRVRFTSFHVETTNGVPTNSLRSGADYCFVMSYENRSGCELANVVGSFAISDDYDHNVLLLRSNFTDQNFRVQRDSGRIECVIKDLPLAPGSYHVAVYIAYGESETFDYVEHAARITVADGDFFGTGSQGLPSNCKILTRADWKSL